MKRYKILSLTLQLLGLGILPNRGFAALGDASFVSTRSEKDAFALVENRVAAPLVVSNEDWAGVRRAADDLRSDIERVTSSKPDVGPAAPNGSRTAVLIGTLGHSPLIDGLVQGGKLDVGAIAGRWEAFLLRVVEKPMPGLDRALVIAGSDKRGTIYGIYELSEQIGVSPWYWWADVPAPHRETLFVASNGIVVSGPAVRYRGIFLNDEAPALSGWAKEKFGGLNSKFYSHVFELLLRLRANYLWPAMWSNAFNEDDPENARMADEYGIVMGTSHHEPMIRSQREWHAHGEGPWNYEKNGEALRRFWTDGVRRNRAFESIATIGMRGDGDEAMSEGTNVALLEQIVADQREILRREVNPDLTKVPQLWALYKEVQTYYEHGMRVPDDVILLWCDDNYGNLRRLPTAEERKRPGGAGIYFHFDYVGWPRSYKWLNTNSVAKVWEQLRLAREYGADRLWIVNVGDLKPMEFPIEFFLRYAWSPESWPYERLSEFGKLWATREFGPQDATEISELVETYTKYNSWIRPESLSEEPFSMVNYGEAKRVVENWDSLLARAERVNERLPQERKDAYFQLVLYPIQACAVLNEMYISAGYSRLYALQGRAAANAAADRARALFLQDAALTKRYNEELAGGKWRHFADQTHIGYAIWQQPPRNAMPSVAEIQATDYGEIGVAVEGVSHAWPEVIPGQRWPAVLPLDSFACSQRTIEVFNRGLAAAPFSVEVSDPWIRASIAGGVVPPSGEVFVRVEADWNKAPRGDSAPRVIFRGARGERVALRVPCHNYLGASAPPSDHYIEAEGYVTIDAPHFARAVGDQVIAWQTLPGYGRGTGGVTTVPVTAESSTLAKTSPHLEYQFFTISSGPANVELAVSPTLAFAPGRGLRLGVSIDDEEPQVVDLKIPVGDGQEQWGRTVVAGVRKVSTHHLLARAGAHVVKIWRIDPGVVLQNLTVSFSAPRPSFFGPPESVRTK